MWGERGLFFALMKKSSFLDFKATLIDTVSF